MGFFDMFDKLDDIVYKPVEAICDWIEEPLKKWEHNRDMKSKEQNARIQEEMNRLEIQLEAEREENAAKLQLQRDKWNVEINQMIIEQEDAHRDQLVESIKNYQIQLANASKDIVESIGLMSLKMRRMANDLVIEKTREYKKIQDEVKEQSRQELLEAKKDFYESDPETYRILVEDIIRERRSMFDTAANCITELSVDLRRLNENSDILMKQGMETVTKYLEPMARALGGVINSTVENGKMIEKKEVQETDIIDSSYKEV